MNYFIFILLGFCSGSIMYSQIFPYILAGKDITRLSDDRNPGCSNVFHHTGVPMGILCLVFDIFKGTLPVLWSLSFCDMEHPLFALVMAAPVLGHASSFCILKTIAPQKFQWMKNTSGKAIAVSFGSLIGLMPDSFLVFALVIPFLFFSIVCCINPHSYRVIVSFGCFLLLAVNHHCPRTLLLGCFLISTTVIAKHLFFSRNAHESFRMNLGLRRKNKIKGGIYDEL